MSNQYTTAARRTGVLLVTHGSVVAEANDLLLALADSVRRRLGTELIEPCFMDLAQPDIPTAIRKLVVRGCNHIFGCALFLVPGRHLAQDVPRLIEGELKNHAGVSYELTPPMLADALLVDFIARRIAAGIAGNGTTNTLLWKK